ncbi:MAG: TPM domain-containing protein, partial [Nitrospirae bacterium]|nr:TPM domain-containing protein [Nitrospirota bacterium]
MNIDKIKPLKILYPACILFFIFLFTLSAHALDVPKLQGHVNDYANMLSPSTKAELEKELNSFEQTDSTQIVILTIPSLEGEVLGEFSIKAAEAWMIGQKGKDNGIIITVAKQEKKIRVEVGRGLEGVLTDLAAGRIVNLVIEPRFKRGDFDGGFVAGVHSLIDATRGEFKADKNHLPKKKDTIHSFLTILIFGGIVLLFIGSMSRIFGGVSGAIGLPALVHLALTPIGLIVFIGVSAAGLLAGLFLPKLFSSGSH